MALLWLDDVTAEDFDSVGGKGASLGELTAAGLPVPPGFVVTAETYRSFIEDTDIDEELFEAVDVSVDDSEALARGAQRAQELVRETEMPEHIREEIVAAYDDVDDGEASVAVRSSATAEDLPDASFAGQQETYLNVTRSGLLDRVRDCWASLFTQRAIYYRQEQGFSHEQVNIAVVVQLMVDAEKSGVMFTSHPTTGAPQTIIESAWGLGEAVVSGAVSPDKYVLDRETGQLRDATVATKKVMHVRDEETGETIERAVPEDKRDQQVLSDAELDRLVGLGDEIEAYYGDPQDVEWAIADVAESGEDSEARKSESSGGDLYVLQSRPITTIEEDGDEVEGAANGVGDVAGVADGGSAAQSGGSSDTDGNVVVNGIGAGPGRVSGPVRIVRKLDHLDKVEEGDLIVAEMTTPDMVPAMKRAAGIVTDEGGMTSHAAIVSRELGVPAIVGTEEGSERLHDGQVVTIDGDKGTVEQGDATASEEPEPVEEVRPQAPVKPMTATEVKVNVSIPDAAERAAATGADGVGLLRIEHMILSTNKTPERYIADHGEDAYVDEIVDGVRGVAEEFYPRPVRVRTLDAPTDEFRQLEGGEDDNVEIMFPLVNDAEDVLRARTRMEEAGIDPDTQNWGVMIETPAAALGVESMADEGFDFVSFGTNDLTQYTLAVDRNNERVADRFDELHPSVLKLITGTIETCREMGVSTSICGQAASKPEMVTHLVNEGVTSISANIDAVRDVQHEVKRVEQKLLLDNVR
ncbi:phosphoenolpyruvate synthase [Halobacteriales archaeon QS_9_67_15]|nr:MAG: phosphoenolpyruvate synthase [Halobacteriales archaeon QS_9_67_15]